MPDTNQALGQDMDQEAPQELVCGESHDLLLAAASVVFPAEGNALSVEADEAMVGDGDAVRVAGEIVENMLGSAEGWLGIDDPLLGKEPA